MSRLARKTRGGLMVPLTLAFVLDLIDWAVVGMVPVLGGALDVLGVLMLYPFIGLYAALGLAELIPLVDVLPTFMASVLVWHAAGGKGGGGML